LFQRCELDRHLCATAIAVNPNPSSISDVGSGTVVTLPVTILVSAKGPKLRGQSGPQMFSPMPAGNLPPGTTPGVARATVPPGRNINKRSENGVFSRDSWWRGASEGEGQDKGNTECGSTEDAGAKDVDW
jgi:hypothetical protein